MTVGEFVNKYDQLKGNSISKNAMLKEAITTYYLPIEVKRTIIEENILGNLLHYNESTITYDSIDKTVIFMMSIVVNYTNLVIDDIYDDFDLLVGHDILNDIIGAIGSDTNILRDLFEMRLNDVIREHNSLESVVDRKLNAILNPSITFINKATSFLGQIDAKSILNDLTSNLKKASK